VVSRLIGVILEAENCALRHRPVSRSSPARTPGASVKPPRGARKFW